MKLNTKLIKSLAAISCTHEEIAAVLDVSADTIERRFLPVIEIGRQKCRASLRRKMYETAMSDRPGAVTAQIFLAKNYLGMRDNPEQTAGQTIVMPLPETYFQAINQALGFTGELKPLGAGDVIEGQASEFLPE